VQQITGVFTYLTPGGKSLEATDVEVSSVIDTWLVVRDLELGGERKRGIYIIKSRGTAHSNQVREFLLTNQGVELREVYLGPGGARSGSLREIQEGRETQRKDEFGDARRESVRKRGTLAAQIRRKRGRAQ
jgi:circadian clock protein KaiC